MNSKDRSVKKASARKWVSGFVVGLLVPLFAVFLFLELGFMPVATHGKALPLEQWAARTALHAAMKGEENREAPFAATQAHLMNGAKVYLKQCAVCHGLPGSEKSAIAAGMFPRPPHLFKGKGVTDDPAGESYWRVKNGIRLTGMPGFEKSLSDEELWEVSLLVRDADKLPAGVVSLLNAAKRK